MIKIKNNKIKQCLGLGQGRGQGLGQGRGFGLGLGRKKIMRNIEFVPKVTYFKPNGIPVKELKVIKLEMDEFEALRLKNVENLNQIDSAKKMGVSQSTFARILNSVNKKIGQALVKGYAIEINNSEDK